MIHEESAFKFYSFGIVVEDKKLGSDIIRVTPIEEIGLATGQKEELIITAGSENSKPNVDLQLKEVVPLGDQTMQYNVALRDHQGIVRNESVKADVSFEATWIPLSDSNRITSPDVVKSETVMIFKVADTDEYYWSTILSEYLRRLETVITSYSNKPKGIDPYDSETSYWTKVSTHEKLIHLHTAKNDGETTDWDIKLDTGNGILSINDNIGNTVVINSPEGTMVTTMNTQFTVITPLVYLDTPTVVMTGDLIVKGTVKCARLITGPLYAEVINCAGNVYAADFIKSPVAPPTIKVPPIKKPKIP